MTILASISTSLPEHSMAQSDAAALAASLAAPDDRRRRSVDALYRRTHVRRRHCVLLNSSTNGSPAQQDFFRPRSSNADRGPSTAQRMRRYERMAIALALRAAESALEKACVEAERVSHLVTASCTGFSAPGYDLALIDRLPLPRDVQRTHVGFMGCHGALNALRAARAYCRADRQAVALVCAVELCSLHFQYGDQPHTIVSNALFSDGAAAAVVQADDGGGAWRLAAHGSTVLPDSADAMTWRIGNHGFEMYLSPRTPELIRNHLAAWLDPWLARHGLRRDNVGSWAIHPGGPRILQACSAALNLPEGALDASWHVLETFGNMSSPTVLFILDELKRREARLPAVALAFGPGLTVEAALVL